MRSRNAGTGQLNLAHPLSAVATPVALAAPSRPPRTGHEDAVNDRAAPQVRTKVDFAQGRADAVADRTPRCEAVRARCLESRRETKPAP
jgi:hypothetical protein